MASRAWSNEERFLEHRKRSQSVLPGKREEPKDGKGENPESAKNLLAAEMDITKKEDEQPNEVIENLELSLAEARSKTEKAEARAAKSEKELVEQRKMSEEEETRLNEVIERTENNAVNIYGELKRARKRIVQLEKQLESVATKQSENAQTKKGKKRPNDSLNVARIVKEEELEEPIDQSAEAPNDTSETIKVEKRRSSLRGASKHPKSMDGSDFGDDKTPVKRVRWDPNIEKTTDKETVKMKRRSSKIASKSVKRPESMEDSDGDEKPPVKKIKSEDEKTSDNKRRSNRIESQSKSASKGRRVSTNNNSQIDCPECHFRTQCVRSWREHLKNEHSTTPALAGFALLCRCGHESFTEKHSLKCKSSVLTVVCKRIGLIRRLSDAETAPQCVMCEAHPKTAFGYASHLRQNHNSSLEKNGIYLLCSCSYEVLVERTHPNHSKECDGRQFTIHKLDEK